MVLIETWRERDNEREKERERGMRGLNTKDRQGGLNISPGAVNGSSSAPQTLLV